MNLPTPASSKLSGANLTTDSVESQNGPVRFLNALNYDVQSASDVLFCIDDSFGVLFVSSYHFESTEPPFMASGSARVIAHLKETLDTGF